MGMIDQINRRFVVVNEKMNGGVSPTYEKTVADVFFNRKQNLREKTSTKRIKNQIILVV